MIQDIYQRAKLMSKTCLKIALVLPSDKVLPNLIRGHLIDKASAMAIKAKGLMASQNPELFLHKLADAKEASDGCQYWLELVQEEGYLDSSIIDPILEESQGISRLFALALTKVKPEG